MVMWRFRIWLMLRRIGTVPCSRMSMLVLHGGVVRYLKRKVQFTLAVSPLVKVNLVSAGMYR